MDKITVLLPCYNEALTISKVVRDFIKALPDAVVYVYDNNSQDETAKLAADAGAVVRHEYSQGKGNVIRRMFREIDAECYIIADGDDTYPAESAMGMAELVLKKDVDMVIGDMLSSTYFTENKRLFHNTGNRLVRKLINFMFKSEFRDIMSGYRALSYQFVKTFPVLSKGFEIETEMSIHAANYHMRYDNVAITYRDRQEGSMSKLDTLSDGAKVLRSIFLLYKNYKPFKFFSMIAVILLLASLALFLPVFMEYINTGLVPRFPTLILCGFMAMACTQSFFGGLILDTIMQNDKKDFELRLVELDIRRRKEMI